jgi:hypothetical protein
VVVAYAAKRWLGKPVDIKNNSSSTGLLHQLPIVTLVHGCWSAAWRSDWLCRLTPYCWHCWKHAQCACVTGIAEPSYADGAATLQVCSCMKAVRSGVATIMGGSWHDSCCCCCRCCCVPAVCIARRSSHCRGSTDSGWGTWVSLLCVKQPTAPKTPVRTKHGSVTTQPAQHNWTVAALATACLSQKANTRHRMQHNHR